MTSPARCPCLSGLPYDACCGRFHSGENHAPTAEALMRSRFSAFALGDAAYLLRSWHSRTRPAVLDLDADLRWYRLDILATTGGGMLESDGTVEFIAYFRSHHSRGDQHEVSRFTRESGRWVYLDGR